MYFAFSLSAQCLTEGCEVLSKLMFVSCSDGVLPDRHSDRSRQTRGGFLGSGAAGKSGNQQCRCDTYRSFHWSHPHPRLSLMRSNTTATASAEGMKAHKD